MPNMKLFRFQVVGAGAFPLDMLRYDACSPDTQADVAKIDDAIHNPSVKEGPRTITLSRYAERGWTPTGGRWVSFGWQVVAGSVRS